MTTSNFKMQDSRIAIPRSDSIELITLSQILRCEGMQHHTKVILNDGKEIVSICSLGVYRKSLVENGFFCCHKSHLINVNYLKSYSKKGYVEMLDGFKVPVSRRKKDDFMTEVMASFDKLNFLESKKRENNER